MSIEVYEFDLLNPDYHLIVGYWEPVKKWPVMVFTNIPVMETEQENTIANDKHLAKYGL